MGSTQQVKYSRTRPAVIVLVGFMGSGKSTLGRKLARRLGIPFTDLDEAIEKAAGAAVPEIFEKRGEKAFRRLETRALRTVLRPGAAGVVAAGGGLLKEPVNRRLLKARGARIVWIDTSWEGLWSRLGRLDHRSRPLLATASNGRKSERQVRLLWQARRPVYAGAATLRLRVPAGERPGETLRRLLEALSAATQ